MHGGHGHHQGQDDGHGHGHNHDGQKGQGTCGCGSDDKDKLKIRIEHWIAHNGEHRATLEEWSLLAKEMGLAEVGASLTRAAEFLDKSVDELRAAREKMQ